MAKKWTASSQQLKPDPKYDSKLVSKFINCMMWGGKKSTAQRIFYDAMEVIAKKMKSSAASADGAGPQDAKVLGTPAEEKDGKTEPSSPVEVFETAVNNVKPLLEVRSKRVGGASYQVPMQVSPKRQQSLAFRWILQAARAKTGKPMCERLASELMDAYNKHGGAMTTRENIHRMAEANKAFAHFAW
jgi:small subunit ribosomal protein S7